MATQNSTTRFVSALALLATLVTTPISAAPFRVGGPYIAILGRDTTGCVQVYVSAYRAGTATVLVYNLLAVCLEVPETIASGSLQIPNDALVITRTQATLSVALPVGIIQITLTRDGLINYAASGQYRLDLPDISIRSHGTRSEQSAAASGDVFTFVLDSVSATVGSSQDLYVEIVRKQ